jgi:hypothetical protein
VPSPLANTRKRRWEGQGDPSSGQRARGKEVCKISICRSISAAGRSKSPY